LSITKPFVAMPMFDQKRDDKHWDDECLTLLCSFAPDSVMQLYTLGKKLSVKMLNEYCKAVGLYVPANTLRADLRHQGYGSEVAREFSSFFLSFFLSRMSLTRFRLGNSGLGVEKARFEGVTFIDRTCTRCTEGVVDDAMHFIFECTATSSIREQPEFAMTLQNNNENLHDFMLSPCAPLFVHLALKCVTESPEPLEGEGGLAA
ncbi:hypothetical protein QJQ45_024979, partial [Haematococcus lacustris]